MHTLNYIIKSEYIIRLLIVEMKEFHSGKDTNFGIADNI
jgi:hypothetical protein